MHISVVLPGDQAYGEASEFAREVYAHRLSASIQALPDAFACARHSALIGCFGIYLASGSKELLVERYMPELFARIAGYVPERSACAELGTRALVSCGGFASGDVSIALTVMLVIYGWQHGRRHFAFTASRTALAITRALRIDAVRLGEPDLRSFGAEFRQNWRNFFRVPQTCFGFSVESLLGCHSAVERLRSKGFTFNIPL